MIIFAKIVLILLHVVAILLCRREMHKVAKKSMYSYRIVSILGVIFFLCISLVAELFRLYSTIQNYSEMNDTIWYYAISDLTTIFTAVIILVFIPAALFSIMLLISNIVLLCKEGFSLAHVLGFLSALVLTIGTFATIYVYNALDLIMNVHSYAGYHFSLAVENIFAILLAYFECMMLATIYAAFKSMRHKVAHNKDYVIVLGCRVRDDGFPGGTLRKRVEAAVKFANEQTRDTKLQPTLVFSGGKGDDEPVSEAESMQKYTASKNYDGKILLEDKSTTTHENFKYSKEVIGKTNHIAFATSDYHIFRSGVFATALGYKHIEGIGSKSPWYYYYNALIREYIANLNAERKMHIFNVIYLCVTLIVILVISYIFNLL